MTKLHKHNAHFALNKITGSFATVVSYHRSERQLIRMHKIARMGDPYSTYYASYLTDYARTRAEFIDPIIK